MLGVMLALKAAAVLAAQATTTLSTLANKVSVEK
jgi:hypothetical protein